MDIVNFMNNYNLTLFSAPDIALPVKPDSDQISYTYVFEAHLPPTLITAGGVGWDYFVEISQQMFENDTAFVNNAEPNFVNFRGADRNGNGGIVNSPIQGNYTCPTNDPMYGDMNNIENTGTNVPYSQVLSVLNGVAGADANICGCWSQGLSGSGIKVGVIGSDDFCMTHPDMTNKYDLVLRWDCSSGGCLPLVSSCPANVYPSGQRLASILAQEGDNGEGAVGVAPNVTIVPYKIGGNNGNYNTGSTVSFVKALDQALADGVIDVIVTDFFIPTQSPSIKASIRNHFEYGRTIPGSNPPIGYGTVIVAPAGFTTNSTGSTANFYPAAGDYLRFDDPVKIISVIGSNRFDQLCVEEFGFGGGGQKYSLPSHYGSQYDVASPGPRIPSTAQYESLPNIAHYEYSYQPHTGAVATVAGIAAMVLEQYPTLTAQQVRQAIIDGAEQVGGYTYTNNISNELGHGRVNCANTISVLTSVSPSLPNNLVFEVSYTTDIWQVKYDISTLKTRKCFLQIRNVLGQEMQTISVDLAQSTTDITNSPFVQGVYFI